jgi:DNA-binding SARP family transcriptional activator
LGLHAAELSCIKEEQVKFYVLGPLKVATNTGPVIVKGKRLRAVLGILLLHPSAIVSMDRIIDGVWPKDPPKSAVENIRTYIWQLRSHLRNADGSGRLESHPAGYRLLVEPEELDLLRFAALATDGRQALHRGNTAEAAVMLEQAMSLWRGDALPELDLGPAIRAKTDALNEQRRQVELDWIRARLALGEHAEMVALLRELTAGRPLDEDLWRYLVVTLYASGRTAEALSAYARARRNLVDELGLEPGPELHRVHAAILGGKEVPEIPLHGVAARPRRTGTIPRQLPASDPGFVGRDEVTASVRGLVEESRIRGVDRRAVVMLSGPPGVGKSATAIAAGAAVRAEFPDGQLYVDLRGSTDTPLGAADGLASVLDGFGLGPEAIPESMDRRRVLYRSLLAERRMLILLDDAATASQVVPLVPGHGQSLLVVTSTRRLAGVDADVRISLEPLSGEEAVRMIGEIAGHERVRREPTAAKNIVDACGRLPLAIRIVGARLAARPEHPFSAFQERLRREDRIIDELALDNLAMRTRLDASYRALDPSARRCFRALGRLGPNSITAAGLAGLLGLPSHAADRELERLVHEGLLLPGIVQHSSPRYRMPRLLHIYAREQLAPEGTDLRVA